MQFSLRTAFLSIAVFAVFFACLGLPKPIVASLFYSFAVVALALGAIAAICSKEAARIPWIGFSVVGFVYYVVALWTPTQENPFLAAVMPTQPSVITDWGVDWLFEMIHADPNSASTANSNLSPLVAGMGNLPQIYKLDPSYLAFRTVAHSSLGLIFGALGALFSIWLTSTRSAASIGKSALRINA